MSKETVTKEYLEEQYCRGEKTMNEICKDAGVHYSFIKKKLMEYGIIEVPRHHRKWQAYVGTKIGYMTVLEVVYGDHRTKFRCLCDCGKEFLTMAHNATDPSRATRRHSCGCMKSPKDEQSKRWKGVEGFPHRLFNSFKYGAALRKLEFDITLEDMLELFKSQNGLCRLTGEVLTLERRDCNASLDRIDSSKGYIGGNLQWVLKQVNLAKGRMTTPQFIEMCRKVAEYHEKKNIICE